MLCYFAKIFNIVYKVMHSLEMFVLHATYRLSTKSGHMRVSIKYGYIGKKWVKA